MKNKMLLLAALLCCMFTFTSCGDDEPNETVTANATYTVNFGADFFKAAKVIIYYKTANNEYNWEAVTSGTKWTKSVSTTKFPAQLGFDVRVTYNDEADLTQQETYDLTLSGTISASTTRGASFTNSKDFISSSKGGAVAATKVNSLLKEYGDNMFGYILNKDGNAYQASLSF